MSKDGKYTYEPGEDGHYRIRRPNGKIYLPHELARYLNSAKLQKFKKYVYEEGNVLVVQHPAGMGDPTFTDALQQFADMVYAHTGINPVVIAVNKLSEITVMDEERMEKYGWIKKSRVLMLKDDTFDKVSDIINAEDSTEEE